MPKRIHVGKSAWRLKDNPLERVFAEAWEKRNTTISGRHRVVDYMLNNGDQGAGKAEPHRDAADATVTFTDGDEITECKAFDLGAHSIEEIFRQTLGQGDCTTQEQRELCEIQNDLSEIAKAEIAKLHAMTPAQRKAFVALMNVIIRHA